MMANMISALNNALDLCLAENEDIVIMGEDVAKDGGVFRVTDGLLDKYGPTRVMNTPLAENSIIGTAVGMALGGMHPFPEIQFGGFSYQAFSQIMHHAARFRTRTRSKMPIPMVIRFPASGGVGGPEIHSESPEALFSHIGSLVVIEASTPYDAKGLLISASHLNDPVVFIEPTKLYRMFKQEVPEDSYEVPIGKANVVNHGDDITIITYGTMSPVVQNAVKDKKVSADVIDLRTINPLDEKTILDSVKRTGRALIVHEDQKSFSVGAEVSAVIAEKAMFELKAPILRVAGFHTPIPFAGYENYWIPNEKRVSQAIDSLLSA
ncbi:2-oxoacid dehydrogenase multienzyme complex, 2-oxoacid decarboxylase (E1) component subunit beta [Candidatus Mancarchaeum acidiphilum]|uniref:2-oxoacid dehydrogenase multienzyme complex, 2-oxoacid decarboxylase (E1) component subunit beta n=1 Tax=Candidatus Mancarchaeum acidiphilum TaxID=1920749 RepID=A0A218NN23_9ARCH|nr:2-oxoacid dehydrogenase multienzyme complex, 2-oxoacid decarboxylase (E1) component subunit beta [Candidatus Mancarchaeum acidiphilum]